MMVSYDVFNDWAFDRGVTVEQGEECQSIVMVESAVSRERDEFLVKSRILGRLMKKETEWAEAWVTA